MKGFCAVCTQWRVATPGLGGLHYLGLDYAAARAGLEMAGFEVTPPLWEGVRVMEAEARASLNGG